MATNRKLEVSTRLAAGFGIVLLLLIIVATTGLVRLAGFNQQFQDVADDKVPKILASNEWLYRLMETARHTRNILILDDEGDVKKEMAAIVEDKQARAGFMEQLKKTVVSPAGKAALQKIIDSRAAYAPHEDAFLKLAESGDKAGAKMMLLQSMLPKQLEYIAALRKFIESQNTLIQTAQDEAEAGYVSTRMLMIILSVSALLAGVLAAWTITRGLLRQLGGEPDYAASVADGIARGDLSMHIELQSGDNSSLMFSIKKMRDDLRQIVSNVRQGTDTIATASGQIAAGNQDLSSRTEQQASSLEETASSMEELTSTVKQNADNARQASTVAASAADVAGKGGVVVAQVVQTMGAINESAKKIVDIISVIDDIAFQTNILALNAAVEAARAGEQGRGFAVVASEVRNLAQRSASAAKEIKTLIHDSVEKVDAGSKLVDQAGSTMNQVVASVRRVTDIIGEITAASEEQTAGIEQINEAISQMDNVTQQNAALVEEAAAAAASLQDQAGNLARVVSVFKLVESVAAPQAKTRMADRMAPAHRQAGARKEQARLGDFKEVLSNY